MESRDNRDEESKKEQQLKQEVSKMIIDSDQNEADQAEKAGEEGAAAADAVKTELEAANNVAENKNSSPLDEAAAEQSKAAVSTSKPGSKPVSKQGSAEFKAKPAALEAGAADVEMKEQETDVKVEVTAAVEAAAASGVPKEEDVKKDLAEDK